MTTEDFILDQDRKVFYNSFRLRAAISGEIALVRNSRTGINAINFKRRLCDVRWRWRGYKAIYKEYEWRMENLVHFQDRLNTSPLP